MFTTRSQHGAVANTEARWKVGFLGLGLLAAASAVGLGSRDRDATTAQAEPASASLIDGVWQIAQLTTFTSYPECCPGSPVYDPGAPTDECDDYSACQYMGEFAVIGKQSFEWVKSHDLIAFYDDADPDGSEFHGRYGGRTIKLRKDGHEFQALIADTCGNQDCNGCCSENSQGGYLVDIEYWTAERHLGGAHNAYGTIEFQIVGLD